MGFHMYPHDLRVQSLFRGSPKKLLKTRIPIAERAQITAQNRSITYNEALRCCKGQNFTLGTNHFSLFNSSEIAEEKLKATVISHFGSIFKNSYVGMWFDDHPNQILGFTLKAAEEPVKFRKTALEEKEFFRLDFKIFFSTEMLWFWSISSKTEGFGGKALGALYNIGKDLGLGKIEYSVMPGNVPFIQFLFHTDFGKPINENWDRWEVNFPPKI